MAQDNWIRNDTLQNNILFGLPMHRATYTTALEAAALMPDLAVLPAGDQTEIGKAELCTAAMVTMVFVRRLFINDVSLDPQVSAVLTSVVVRRPESA